MKTTTDLWSLQLHDAFWVAETSRDLGGSSSQAAAAQSVGENPAAAQSWWNFFFPPGWFPLQLQAAEACTAVLQRCDLQSRT